MYTIYLCIAYLLFVAIGPQVMLNVGCNDVYCVQYTRYKFLNYSTVYVHTCYTPYPLAVEI